MKYAVIPFRIGFKVTSDFHNGEGEIVRTITNVGKDADCMSGWFASADGGEPCESCGRMPGTEITHVDAPWFRRVNHA